MKKKKLPVHVMTRNEKQKGFEFPKATLRGEKRKPRRTANIHAIKKHRSTCNDNSIHTFL